MSEDTNKTLKGIHYQLAQQNLILTDVLILLLYSNIPSILKASPKDKQLQELLLELMRRTSSRRDLIKKTLEK